MSALATLLSTAIALSVQAGPPSAPAAAAESAAPVRATPDRAAPYVCEVTAIEQELKRGLSSLRLEEAPSPYLAVARVMRWKSLALDGSYGGIITDVEELQAVGTIEVRVGAPARDNGNVFGMDGAQNRFLLPFAPSAAFTRKKLWLAMDQAFRAASSVYAAKQSILARLAGDPLPPDLGAGPATLPRVDVATGRDVRDVAFDRPGLRAIAAKLSARFSRHPEIDNGDVFVQVLATDGTVVSSEGLVMREQSTRAVLSVTAQSRATDGMLIDHAGAIFFQDVPKATPELEAQGAEMVDRVLRELKEMAAAPMIEEDFDGPVLFESLAAAQLLASTVATQAAGTPAPLADGGRLRELEPLWQDSLGKSVMPDFVALTDDPTAQGFGHYAVDAEGFAARPTQLVKNGTLEGLLMTRAPNEHRAVSNGHARMSPVLQVGPAISNLTLSSRKTMNKRGLERELLRRAREDGYEFAYVVESLRDGNILGPVPREAAISYSGGRKVSLPTPARVYRIGPGGKRTLVRGAVFSPVSMRVLRRIRAVGRESSSVPLRIQVGSLGGFTGETGMDGILSHTVDVQVTTPALLVEGLELLTERGENERLPTLVHPLRDSDWKWKGQYSQPASK